jgi:hypothetical protein
VLVIEDNLCNNYCNISLNRTYRDFLYKWTFSYIHREEKNIQEGGNFSEKKGKQKNPNPILSSKEAVATLSSFFFKKMSSHPTPLKKGNRDHSLERELPLHLPISQTQQKRTSFDLQKPPYRLSSCVTGEAFVFFFFLLVQRTSSRCHKNNIITAPHGWFLFGRNTTVKLVHVYNSKTPSLWHQ